MDSKSSFHGFAKKRIWYSILCSFDNKLSQFGILSKSITKFTVTVERNFHAFDCKSLSGKNLTEDPPPTAFGKQLSVSGARIQK